MFYIWGGVQKRSVNIAKLQPGRAGQNRTARAGTNITQPRTNHFWDLCTLILTNFDSIINVTLNSPNRCSMSTGVEESIADAGVRWADQKSLMPFDDTFNKTRNCRLYQIGQCPYLEVRSLITVRSSKEIYQDGPLLG